MLNIDQAMGMFVGLAIGDALGAPLEFQQSRNPENYITDFEAGGAHSVKVGEWTDDTAMTLAMAEAILAEGHFVPNAVMDNFVGWYMNGEFIPRGVCFDIGNATRNALERYIVDPTNPYKGTANPETAGNGALMRTAAVVLAAKSREQVLTLATQQTLLTHAAPECVVYGTMFAEELYYASPLEKYRSFRHQPDINRHKVMSGGYVVETYQAAMWAFQTTDNFTDCLIAAVNRGHDSDTTGAVAGMLAGAHYGYAVIPAHFKEKLLWHDRLAKVAADLFFRKKNKF